MATEGERYITLADMVRVERIIEEKVSGELALWLLSLDGALAAQSVAFLPSIDVVAGQLQQEWDENHLPEILTVVALAWRKRYKKKRKAGYEAQEARFLSQVREALTHVPERFFATVRQETDAFSKVALGQSRRQFLDTVSTLTRKEADIASNLAARLVGPWVVNDAGLSAASDDAAQFGTRFTKSWVNINDNRVRETHAIAGHDASNHRIPLGAWFNVGGYAGQQPRDPALPLWETLNCRCWINVTQA